MPTDDQCHCCAKCTFGGSTGGVIGHLASLSLHLFFLLLKLGASFLVLINPGIHTLFSFFARCTCAGHDDIDHRIAIGLVNRGFAAVDDALQGALQVIHRITAIGASLLHTRGGLIGSRLGFILDCIWLQCRLAGLAQQGFSLGLDVVNRNAALRELLLGRINRRACHRLEDRLPATSAVLAAAAAVPLTAEPTSEATR